MILFITLTLTVIAGYLRIKLHEEIESLSAGVIAILCCFLSLLFAPLGCKILLLAILIPTHNKIIILDDRSSIDSYDL